MAFPKLRVIHNLEIWKSWKTCVNISISFTERQTVFEAIDYNLKCLPKRGSDLVAYFVQYSTTFSLDTRYFISTLALHDKIWIEL